MKAFHHPTRAELQLPIVLGAFSDPLRLQLILEMCKQDEIACSSFSLSLPKSTLSHHLKVLRESGIAWVRAQGTHRYLSLRRSDLDARFPGLLAAVVGSARQDMLKAKLSDNPNEGNPGIAQTR